MATLATSGAVRAAAPERFSRGVLWRVSRPKTPESHVFGTVHAADPRLATLAAPVRKAFEAARSLTVEFTADAYARERFLEAAMYLDTRTLTDEIGAADFEKVVVHMAPLGIARAVIAKLKPWGVLVNLRNPRGAHGPTLDEQLYAGARARRLPLHTMENVEEQVFTFDEFPIASQVALLRHALAHQAELVALSERTIDAYVARDLAGLWALQTRFVARYPEIASHNAVFVKRVIFDRSVVMAFRMQRQLRRGHAFVALGALHLHGPRGVLALLEEDGYRVARVY
ncbi:MAG: TraB/GumN family protein [Proteobacteria bacterium]|nr:TraB/GumN family protein [Pseudomonadota bacterium]